jgi:hypothetical protein
MLANSKRTFLALTPGRILSRIRTNARKMHRNVSELKTI